MFRKNFFKALTVTIFIISFAFPALGAMSDEDFVELCKSGTAQQVSDTIKAGADVNAKDKNALTALVAAAISNKNPEVIKVLLEAGADVNAKAQGDVTALMLAAHNNENPEVIKTLLNAGADLNAKDNDGRTALDYARGKNNNEIVQLLEPITAMKDADFIELCKSGTAQQVSDAIKAGANVNAKDKNGWTALMWAAFNNENPEVIKTLLNAGADVNAKAQSDVTALMLAAHNNENPEVIKTLLNAGADVNTKSNDGYTALMLAANHNQSYEVIKTLLNSGVDFNIKDNKGKTALDYARERNNTDVVKILETTALIPQVKKSAERGDANAQYQL